MPRFVIPRSVGEEKSFYIAEERRPGEMILVTDCLRSPSANRERTRRSMETEGSPASIFATLDWLDFTSRASSTCERFRSFRRVRRRSASSSFISMNTDSSGESPRKSFAPPTFQPLDSRRFRFASRIVILLQSSLGSLNYRLWRLRCLLRKHFSDDNGIEVNPVQDAPSYARIANSQFVAPCADTRHRSRMGQSQCVASL